MVDTAKHMLAAENGRLLSQIGLTEDRNGQRNGRAEVEFVFVAAVAVAGVCEETTGAATVDLNDCDQYRCR